MMARTGVQMQLDQLLELLGFSQQQLAEPAALPHHDCWGFAATNTTLQQLAAAQHASRDRSPDRQDATYVSKLESSHAFTSNHCVAAMAEQYGISHLTGSLAGTLLTQRQPAAAETDAALTSIRQQIDGAWSREAVRRGVGYAKAGDYQQAVGCYNKALDLKPTNCDAYVARGAAHANQKQFDDAVADFQAALRLDPANVNAAKYLQATQDHLRAAAAAGDDGQAPPAAAEAAAAAPDRQPHAEGSDVGRQQPDRQQQQLNDEAQHPSGARRRDDTQQLHSQQLHSQQQQQRCEHVEHSHKKHHRSRSKSSSSSGGSRPSGSSSSSLSASSSADEGDDGGPARKVLKRPSVADIKEAINVLRSAKKASKKERHKGSSSKKKKHRHKHSSHSKHAKNQRKHKHKKRR